MRKIHWIGLSALVGGLVLVFLLTGSVHSQRPVPPGALDEDLAVATSLPREDVQKVLLSLGPAIQKQLAAGRQVDVPGLGRFRVVQIPEHRDLQNGRPVTVPASNYVEFVPTGGLVDAANSPSAIPAVVVPQFQYNPLPNQTKSPQVGRVRTPSTRSR